jgi:hypothetical protein
VQQGARQRKETGLDMRDLQTRANRCNALFITRNEQARGSSPLVGSFLCLYLRRIPVRILLEEARLLARDLAYP